MIEGVRLLFGTQGLPFETPDALVGATDIGIGYFPTYRLFVIGITGVVLVALWLFLERTPYGLIIRADARDPVIVRILGIDVGRIWLVVFSIGTGLAGLLAAALQGASPEMGESVLAIAFVVTKAGSPVRIGRG